METSTLSAIFILGNLLVSPVYILMVLFPRTDITKRFMSSLWSVAFPSILTVLFGVGFIIMDANALFSFGDLMSNALAASAFDAYHKVLVDMPPAALVMWLHAVAADVVVARWTYFDSLEHKLPAIPVSIAILFIGTNGPLGFLIYLLIRWISPRKTQTISGTDGNNE